LPAKRLKKLEELNELTGGDPSILRIADGVADSMDDRKALSNNGNNNNNNNNNNKPVAELNNAIKCYICKAPYTELHFFYDSLCPSCAQLNHQKRHQSLDLTGRIALVTGARVKIGYQISLKLARANCRVIATTRFPFDLSVRLQQEKDYKNWGHLIEIYGLDFRNLIALEQFCEFLCTNYSHLDIIENNATQTVRKPVQFYKHLLETEIKGAQRLLQPGEKGEKTGNNENTGAASMLRNHLRFSQHNSMGRNTSNDLLAEAQPQPHKLLALRERATATVSVLEEVEGVETEMATESSDYSNNNNSVSIAAQSETKKKPSRRQAIQAQKLKQQQLNNGPDNSMADNPTALALNNSQDLILPAQSSSSNISALSSQLIVTKEDSHSVDNSLFPVNIYDVNRQQLDLRTKNTWTSRLHEIETGEIAEVFAINTIAPTILNSKLKPLLMKSPFKHKFIVNVSAMEGKFYRFKSVNHPHTNMAKGKFLAKSLRSAAAL
jgi:NAD(P)-dependent dehydrogenase (short-subunit alcohol dehydrogenase family)